MGGGRLVFTNRVERGGGAIENMVFSGKRMGISLHQQIRRRGGGGGETVKNRLANNC